jgi:hypothetical protein
MTTTERTLSMHPYFNRIVHFLMVLIGSAQWLTDDLGMAGAAFGLSLAFDPFNPAQAWSERPIFQKVWLLALLGVTFGLLIYSIFGPNQK